MRILKTFEEISSEKVLGAEAKQSKNFAAGEGTKGVEGEVSQYGFQCAFMTYGGLKMGDFEATGTAEKLNFKPSLIVDVEDNSIKSHNFNEADVVKIVNSKEGGVQAIFLKNMLAFVIPNIQGGKEQVFRGWLKTNDRTKVVNFLKKWGLFNKVNVNNIMLLGDKMERLKKLKAQTGELKGDKKKPGVDDIKKILNSESENKAEDILKLFQ